MESKCSEKLLGVYQLNVISIELIVSFFSKNKLVFGYLIDTLEDYVGRILRLSGTSSAPIVSNDNDSAVSYDALQITVRYYILLNITI